LLQCSRNERKKIDGQLKRGGKKVGKKGNTKSLQLSEFGGEEEERAEVELLNVEKRKFEGRGGSLPVRG